MRHFRRWATVEKGTARQGRSTVQFTCRSQDCCGSCQGVTGTMYKLAIETMVNLQRAETLHWDG